MTEGEIDDADHGPFGDSARGFLDREFQGGTMSVNYGLNKVRFPAPVPVGSRIRLAARVATASETPGGAEIVLNAVIELDGSTKLACVAEVPAYLLRSQTSWSSRPISVPP